MVFVRLHLLSKGDPSDPVGGCSQIRQDSWSPFASMPTSLECSGLFFVQAVTHIVRSAARFGD